MNTSTNWLVSILCFFGAIYYGFQYCQQKGQADSSATWSRVTGVMDTMTMERKVTTSSGRYGSRTHTTYIPHVNYHFSSKGSTYHGAVISFPNPTFNNIADADKFSAANPEGGLVSVFFDEKSPASSCLVAGVCPTLNTELWYACGLMVLSAVFCLIPGGNFTGGAYGYGGYNNNFYSGPANYIKPSR